MTEQPAAVVETPKRRIRVKLPSRPTLRNGVALTGAFVLGAVVAKKKLDNACACESDDDTSAGGELHADAVKNATRAKGLRLGADSVGQALSPEP